MCHIFLIHSSAVGHLGSFHLVAVVNSARQYLFEVSPFYREAHRGSEQREDLPKEGIFNSLPDPKNRASLSHPADSFMTCLPSAIRSPPHVLHLQRPPDP